MEFFENFVCKSGLNFGQQLLKIWSISWKRSRSREKNVKFWKIFKSIFQVRKKFPKLDIFFARTRSFSWNRSDFDPNFQKRNVRHSSARILEVGRRPKIQFPDPKICQNPQNGLSQKWSQIGRSYLYGRDTATFRFCRLNVRFLGVQPRSESYCPASLIFLRGPAARLYFFAGGW